jgi:hypothetical protein
MMLAARRLCRDASKHLVRPALPSSPARRWFAQHKRQPHQKINRVKELFGSVSGVPADHWLYDGTAPLLLNQLQPAPGRRQKKRVGRGPGSGYGKARAARSDSSRTPRPVSRTRARAQLAKLAWSSALPRVWDARAI